MRIAVVGAPSIESAGPSAPAYFSTPVIAHLREHGHEVIVAAGDHDLIGLLRAADAAWCEWVDQTAFMAAESGACRRLVLRMRGYDAWGPLDKIAWKNVHALVYESELLKQIAEERHPFLCEREHKTIVLPAGIDLSRFPFRVRPPGDVVALVARAVEGKGYQLAYEWARRRTDLRFFFATAFADANPRFMRYLEHARPPNVTLCGTIDDVPAWLDEIGAGFLLSASSFESLGYSIAEAMAMGIRPLIHDAPGAAKLWPIGTTWKTLGDLDALLESSGTDDAAVQRRRQWVEDRFDAAKLSPKFAELLLEGLTQRVFIGVPVSVPAPNSIALQMIVRDDAAGLERAVLSVRDQVDEIVIGVDGRSDDATWETAKKYGTDVYRFFHDDIGMTREEWSAVPSRIHFANARNFGLQRVRSAWVLTLDSDEFVRSPVNLHEIVAGAADRTGFRFVVSLLGTEHRSVRLARHKHFLWEGATHNQIMLDGPQPVDVAAHIVHDTSVRGVVYQDSRNAQRDVAVRDMRGEAEKGELSALFHLAKHLLSSVDVKNDLAEAARLVEDYRKRTFPHGECVDERWWLAFGIAVGYVNSDQLTEGEVWAVRALLDGPRVEVFCLLGDIAEEQNDMEAALRWYEMACAMTLQPSKYGLPALTSTRHGRLAGIRQHLRRTTPVEVTRFAPLEAPPSKPSGLPFHLFVEHYVDSSEDRQAELDECLRRNLANERIAAVHVYGTREALLRLPAHPKITLTKITLTERGERMTMAHMFKAVGSTPRAIVANADVYFDNTLALLPKLGRTVACLTRWDDTPDGLLFYGEPGSQDAWILDKPCAVPEADFYFGVPGCDNKLALLLGRDRPVWNPSLDVRAIHLHRTAKRNYTKGVDRVPPPYGNVAVARLTADASPPPTTEALAELVRSGTPWNFVKFGDGELGCISGARGANCDGQVYSAELQVALRVALHFFLGFPQTYVAKWEGEFADVRDEFARAANVTDPRYADYHLLLPQEGRSLGGICALYKAIRDSGRQVVFVGPERLARAASMLRAERVVVPESDAFALSSIYDAVTCDNAAIVLFAAGPAAKVFAHRLLQRQPDLTCVDIGSGLDALFVGQTRRGQPAQAIVREAFEEAGLL